MIGCIEDYAQEVCCRTSCYCYPIFVNVWERHFFDGLDEKFDRENADVEGV